MFNEIHNISSDPNSMRVAFVKSLNVRVFPCGRRRAMVDKDGSNTSTSDRYYIPYDPEARLNTEANNRKHSGMNGYTQTYLNRFDNDTLSLVLAGYLFDIKLDAAYANVNTFGGSLSNLLRADNNNSIYANIRIEETDLFSGFTDYTTTILRDQAATEIAQSSLDVHVKDTDQEDPENYYFSGLSFSTGPLPDDTQSSSRNQLVISLKILEKSADGIWQIYQPALLPSIEHGKAENSIKVGGVEATSLTVDHVIKQEGKFVPIISLVEDGSKWQIQISNIN